MLYRKIISKPFLSVLKTNNLDRVFTISVVLLFLSTVLIRYFEPGINSYGDGLWWSIVTTTTVGYGDISPASVGGRVIAVVLMLVGIGLIGMLTGSITTYFVKERKSKHPTVQFVQKELDRYEELTADDMHRLSVVLEELSHEKKP
ncbi:potassium channel family protein [Thalassobacillus sp. B23F22_16]|uniref:potassium channel family protein n=1 Tax=Thalassobacillus sp. B23F22_16 TaxID=3459513 RepID=UPI00373E762C